MVPHLLILGLGYTGKRLASRLRGEGWTVTGTDRHGLTTAGTVAAIGTATHILSSVPPVDGADPVLAAHGDRLRTAPAKWIGYLSSTGVYGDTGGAWVDESAPIGRGRRDARAAADLAWQALRPDVRVFRLPGIYGPGRSALGRVRAGSATRVLAEAPSPRPAPLSGCAGGGGGPPSGSLPPRCAASEFGEGWGGGQPGEHRFSRIHIDDIVAAIVASFDASPAVWNLGDGHPASGNAVTEYACDLLGLPYPAFVPVSALAPVAQGFYTERRLIAATKITRDLGLRLRYPDFRTGLRACLAEEQP